MKGLRIDYGNVAPGAIDGMLSANKHFDTVAISAKLRRLIELRVSQINGCAYCVWLHARQARGLGETEARLEALSQWREADCFHDDEVAALGWAEAVTRIENGAPGDELFSSLQRHFDDCQIVELTGIVANMNALNRMAISFHHEPPSE